MGASGWMWIFKWVGEWVSKFVGVWSEEWVNKSMNVWISEWANGWIIWWVGESVSEGMNERVLVCVHTHIRERTRVEFHYTDVIMGAIASHITSLTIVYSTVYSDADQRKHHSSASLACVWGIHRGPVHSPYKWPVTRKMFPFDDVIMCRARGASCPYLACFSSTLVTFMASE